MINSIEHRADQLVSIHLNEQKDYISCQVFYRISERWEVASLVLDLDAQTVLSGNTYLWDQAQSLGIARLYERGTYTLLWNPYINLDGFIGNVDIKVVLLTVDGIIEDEKSVQLRDQGVVYLKEWDRYVCESGLSQKHSEDEQWTVEHDTNGRKSITIRAKKKLPPLQIPLLLTGIYDIYFGLPKGGVRLLVRLDEQPWERIVTTGNSSDLNLSDYGGKANKEVYWKRQQINGGKIEFTQLLETILKHYDFGHIAYIKLVPCESAYVESPFIPFTGAKAKWQLAIEDLILYYEPYSYSLHGFHDAETMNTIMLEEFIRLKPREIACQSVRIGMKSLHYSKILDRIDSSARTDANTITNDPAKLVGNCDIMAETAAYMQGKGIKYTACIGMNEPYLYLPEIADRFSIEHPYYTVNDTFDYTLPEVQNYAIAIIDELIKNYDIDGLIFDYMRCYHNQTVQSLVEIISRTRRSLDQKAQITGKKFELKVRIPADHPVYYKAMGTCVAGRWLDGIIPSNEVTSEPLPPIEHYLQLCRGTGIKVYGCIDGWKLIPDHEQRAGNLAIAHTPYDLIHYFDEYSKRGVDGVFIYQADQVTGNPYLNKLFPNS